MRLDGRTVLITGGGGRIGAATARRVADEGGIAVLVDRGESAVQAVAAGIRERGGQALSLTGDVTREADVDGAVAEVARRWGRFDGMVVNAGIQLHQVDRPVHEQTLEAWDATQDVNFRGAFLCCRAAARQMLAQGGVFVVDGGYTVR